MDLFLLAHEPAIRLTATVVVFGTVALWETLRPARARLVSRWYRWGNNIALLILNSLLLRLLFPAAAVGFAHLADRSGFGLMHWIHWPDWVSFVTALIFLDLAIYGQHLMFHKIPLFWRLHRMHHADLDLDVTSGIRFHPGEILLSMGIKFLVIMALGAPAAAVLVFEVVLNASAMFNHGNFSFTPRLDRWLRLFLVTPDMHRIHHSVIRTETDSNYGFTLPWWDRLFGTYQAEPEAGKQGLTLGLPVFRETNELRLDRLLTQPFR